MIYIGADYQAKPLSKYYSITNITIKVEVCNIQTYWELL